MNPCDLVDLVHRAPLRTVLDTMQHAVYMYDINHVIIDNLQFMMGQENLSVDKYVPDPDRTSQSRFFSSDTVGHVTPGSPSRTTSSGPSGSLPPAAAAT